MVARSLAVNEVVFEPTQTIRPQSMHSPTKHMNIATALRDLGVRNDTLTAAEKAKLDQDGYLFLSDVMNADLVRKMTARVDELVAYKRAHGIVEGQKEPGTDRVANLLEKDRMFDVC